MTIIQKIKNLSKTYKKPIEKIQLTIFYLISVVLLISTVKEQVQKKFSFITNNILIKALLKFKFFKLFIVPDRSVLWNIICHELFIRRDAIHTSSIVKFNIVLSCFLTMINGLFITYFNFFFLPDQEEFISSIKVNSNINDYIYLVIFSITFVLYTYFYLVSLYGVRPQNPKFLKLVIDSANFVVDKKKFIEKDKEYNN